VRDAGSICIIGEGGGFGRRSVTGGKAVWADDEATEAAIAVIKRLSSAEYARYQPFKLQGGDGSSWQPQQHNCHSNVATIVNWYEGLAHIFGYLILSPSMTGENYWIVIPHSLVEDPQGNLIEVTPGADTEGVPFVRHCGELARHERLRQLVQIFVLPSAVC
jgi:hypothetical protein